MMHQRRGTGQHWQAQPVCQPVRRCKTRQILAVITGRHHQVHPCAKAARQALGGVQPAFRAAQRGQCGRWVQQQLQAVCAKLDKIIQPQLTGAFGCPLAPSGQQPAQCRPALSGLGQNGQVWTIDKAQAGGGDQPWYSIAVSYTHLTLPTIYSV